MPSPEFTTVALAGVTGLSVVAYKTPAIYKSMVPYLMGIITLVEIFILAWDFGMSESYDVLRKFIPVDKGSEALAAYQAAKIGGNVVPYLMLFGIVTLVLFWLSHQVELHQREEEKKRLANFPVGQGLFFAGQNHVHIQVVASATEQQLITTNPQAAMQARSVSQQTLPPVGYTNPGSVI